jgi:Holliday junction DNA helicase RuvA
MIASLRGVLAETSPSACVIEAGGVGYLVHVSSYTLSALPGRGEQVYLRTRQVVREDSVQLFGFADKEELELFDLLIAVSGVGPKMALALLSGLQPAVVVRAIRGEQVAKLTTVSGIGRKTAERIIVELRDKVAAPIGTPKEAAVLPKSAQFQDAVAALTRLGYTAVQAQDVLRGIQGAEDMSLEELVRRSLALLGKSAALTR